MKTAPRYLNKSLNLYRRNGRTVMALRWKRSDKPSLQKSKGPQTYRMKNATEPWRWRTSFRCSSEPLKIEINQLEAEVELFRHRAVRAEYWLQTIQKEIEEKLITPRSANTPEQTSLPKDAEL